MEVHMPGAAAATSPTQQACILLVEDEPLIRILIGDSLREQDYEVIEAFNGDEAVEILRGGKTVDVIFSDVRMPGAIDGLDLLAFVKARFPALPVILTSGHLDPRQAAANGAACFLGKPYRIEQALATVANEVARLIRRPIPLANL